jgi:hypothetical protein
VGFDFTFSFAPEQSKQKKKKPIKLKFAGIWQRDPRTPTFDDRLPLTGWKVYMLGTRTGEQAASYGAVPSENYNTLGALRQALGKQP